MLGRGGDVVLIDDPFGSMQDAQSELERKNVWDWYTGTAYNRLMPGGAIVVINAAAGLTVILPASDGGNARYRFLIGTTVTSNNVIIKVANTTDAFLGQSMMVSDDPATVKGFIAASGDDTITLNGGTKGGFLGDQIEIVDIERGKFAVRITGKQTGAEATMFSATV